MTFRFYTLGCKVNHYESEALSFELEKCGFSRADTNENPDFIIVNSCTVTSESSRKSRQTVRKLKSRFPSSHLVLIGCYSQGFPDEASRLKEADIILGNTDYEQFADTLLEYSLNNSRTVRVSEHKRDEKFDTPAVCRFSDRTRAEVKIQDGCNRFCSYCIIPKCRGRVRSKTTEEIKSEVEALSANGYKEIVLVGINLSAYGQDIGTTLADAVKAVQDIDGIERIRLGSLEFDQISDETLLKLKSCSKFCPQFHLSLQSGCDKILKAMNRHYTASEYYDFTEKIRNTFDDPSITTDIIVGFPGETEEDFNETVKFVKSVRFAKAHVFPFSERAGTPAAKMEGRLEKSVKEDRCRLLISICDSQEDEFIRSQVGKTVRVLFETFSNGESEGYTDNYLRVKVESENDLRNSVHNIKITEAKHGYCLGKL